MRKNVKRGLSLALSAAMVITSAALPAGLVSAAENIQLDATSKTLYIGGSASFKKTTLQVLEDEEPVSATFTSGNTRVATVERTTGVVTAKRTGTATITARYNKKNYLCKVTVKKFVGISSFTVSPKTISLVKGKTKTIKATIKPATASIRTLSYKSANKAVATVSSKGKVTAKKKGSTKITVTTKDGTKKSTKVRVQVKNPPAATPTPAASVEPSTEPTAEPSATPSPTPTATPVTNHYRLRLSTLDLANSTMKADGTSHTEIRAMFLDKQGKVAEDLEDVILKFEATNARFNNAAVSVKDGVATNTLFSTLLTTRKDAEIKVSVLSSKEPGLTGMSQTMKLTMDPTAVVSQTTGANLKKVEAKGTDKLLLTFDRDVDVKKFTKNATENLFGYDASKLRICIDDDASQSVTSTTSEDRTVLGLKQYNTDSIYAILDTSNRNNTNKHPLTNQSRFVVTAIDKTAQKEATSSQYSVVSDTDAPSIVSVELQPNYKDLKITFSEPVQTGTFDNTVETTSAWKIDDKSMDSTVWGSNLSKATVTAGKFDLKTGKDLRNECTITLGKDVYGKQIFYPEGIHMLEGIGIGDWAAFSTNTGHVADSLKAAFTVPENRVLPEATVTVQSPEQFLVTFNTLVNYDEVRASLLLQRKEDTTWTDIASSAGGALTVKAVGKEGKAFLVQLAKDWTEICDTPKTYRSYYTDSYRLHLNAGTVTNATNGMPCNAIDMELTGGAIKKMDFQAPAVKSVTDDGNGKSCTITFTEPVKIPSTFDAYDKSTPVKTAMGMQQENTPKIQFVSRTTGTTIDGHVAAKKDEYDMAFTVEPTQPLSAGEWQVVITGVSDDAGNQSGTLYASLTVTGVITQQSNFKPLWVKAVKAGVNPDVPGLTAVTKDVIYIKYNQGIKYSGTTENAASLSNYTLNGKALPYDAEVKYNLTGYNDKAMLQNNYTDIVAIYLPTANGLRTDVNTLKIAKTVQSANGSVLDNISDIMLIQEQTGLFVHNYKKCIFRMDLEANVNLQLANEANQEFDFTAANNSMLNAKLTLPKAAKLNFTNQMVGSLDISTAATGCVQITGGHIRELTIDAKNADVELKDVTVDNLYVKDVVKGTLKITNGMIIGMKVTDPNGCNIQVDGTAIIINMEINTSSTVVVEGNHLNGISIMDVKAAATLTLNVSTATTQSTNVPNQLRFSAVPNRFYVNGICYINVSNLTDKKIIAFHTQGEAVSAEIPANTSSAAPIIFK